MAESGHRILPNRQRTPSLALFITSQTPQTGPHCVERIAIPRIEGERSISHL